MDREVQSILETVEKFSSSQKLGPISADSKTEIVLFVVAGLSLIATFVFIFYEPLQIIAVIAGLVFLLSMVALAVAQAISAVSVIRAPLRGYASAAGARLQKRVAYIEQLALFSPESLQIACQALESDTSRMHKRLYSLMGAIDKAGFIPAGLALYFSSTKILAGDADFSANILMAFIFGLYSGSFLGHRIIELLSMNVACMQEARAIALKRRDLSVA
ncbi:hypothetical protein KUV59_00005 [Marinobacter daepoensis]|uniref:hypothetical protein n=1 Tax=Marinobacter daepoensis TaxID=262077 RepID=UPI001C9425A8|nr:hypothetical protein [Marinobacter daepoensis]MBY6031544.1 hypothetical protein [Marinobacter daepoensis]